MYDLKPMSSLNALHGKVAQVAQTHRITPNKASLHLGALFLFTHTVHQGLNYIWEVPQTKDFMKSTID